MMNRRKLYLVRFVLVLLGLAAWFGTQQLLGERPPLSSPEDLEIAGRVTTKGDVMLQTLSSDALPAYQWFAAEDARWQALLISSSAMIDVLTLALLAMAVFGKSLRPFLGLLLLFGLRQVCQALCALPAPEGMIWADPGFPSLVVTYGVANDFFFSGHTAIAVYAAVQIAHGGGVLRKLLALGLALFLIASVLLVRAHYVMDVYAGIVTALLATHWASWLAPKADRRLEKWLGGA